MRERTQELLELLAKDAANWDQAAEDMDFLGPLLTDASHRKSAAARAACYRQYAARDRGAAHRIKQELLENEKVTVLD